MVLLAVSVNAQDILRTQTPGGWGASPKGNNPGMFLQNNFDAVFGAEGIIIGSGGNTMTFTSAEAIKNFLPSGGTPTAIEGTYIDPTVEIRNTLSGHLLALTITIGFDRAIEDFGQCPMLLETLEAGIGDLAGMTVAQILEEGNRVLGGETSVYTASQLTSALSLINENYVDGEITGDFLVKPGSGGGFEPPISDPGAGTPGDTLPPFDGGELFKF